MLTRSIFADDGFHEILEYEETHPIGDRQDLKAVPDDWIHDVQINHQSIIWSASVSIIGVDGSGGSSLATNTEIKMC
jgi:hypothetical protein